MHSSLRGRICNVDRSPETVTKADLRRIDALMAKAYEVIEVLKNHIARLETQASGKEIGVVKASRKIAVGKSATGGLGTIDQSKLFSSPEIKEYAATMKAGRKALRGDPDR
jgi:hypothetical protein